MKLTFLCLLLLHFGIALPSFKKDTAFGGEPPKAPIEFLTPPRYAPTPRLPDDSKDPEASLKKSKKKKSLERAQREDPFRPKPKTWQQKITENLRKDLDQPRQRDYLIELSFTAPFTLTTGAKSGYSQNLSQLFECYWRRGGSMSDGQSGLFIGMRLAAFSGNGFYHKEPGSFGLLYFGPAIGWGRLESSGGSQSQTLSSSNNNLLSSTDGFLWSFGIAATHRQGVSETTPAGDLNNDFATRKITFDSPGLWSEVRFLRTYLGALSLSPLMGFQAGREKLILYFGFGLGGWT